MECDRLNDYQKYEKNANKENNFNIVYEQL